jgi:hypothetical protein
MAGSRLRLNFAGGGLVLAGTAALCWVCRLFLESGRLNAGGCLADCINVCKVLGTGSGELCRDKVVA